MEQEFAQATVLCEKQHKLYPTSRVKNLMIQLYTELIECMHSALVFTQLPRVFGEVSVKSFQEDFQEAITSVHKLSKLVIREVEYYHRVQLQYAHHRLVHVEVEQHKIVTALDEQKKILASLAEERRLVTMMNDQQLILQALQQLQMKKLSSNESNSLC